jgi:hypothetical protein
MRKGPRWIAFMALLSPLAAIDEREFACEEAFHHVEECCPVRRDFRCGAACDPVDTSLATADCLRKASCEELITSGACEEPLAAVCP